MKRKIAVEVICFLFVVLFVYAAASKLIDLQKFRIQIGQSPLLTSLGPLLSWLIPTIEIIVAVLVSSERLRLFGLYASFGLMVMFTTYITAILFFSVYVPCSCGGILEELGWKEHLIFNSVFVLLAAFGVLLHPFSRNEESQRNSPSEVAAVSQINV
jgi:hypothetical protein